MVMLFIIHNIILHKVQLNHLLILLISLQHPHSRHVKGKVEAFYGIYVLYFSGLFLLLFIIDKATIKGKTIKSLAAKLAEAAEASKVYKDEKMDLSSDFIDTLKDLAVSGVEAQIGQSITQKIGNRFSINSTSAAIITTAGNNMILSTESYVL